EREQICRILNDMFTALVKVQDKESGLWYLVLDQAGRDGNYLEGTASSMFVYSMAKAARLGYVDKKFASAAKRGWQGLRSELVEFDESGYVNLNNCCAVAGLGGNPYRDGSYEYYIGEKVRANDPKGIGPLILAAMEFEENK
ncbi:MAG: glycoside hydrolase family 88 protein, partial [Phycisphaerae bacterium]